MAKSPWAKLNTRDVRYSKTIPSPTRAYKLPMESPLTTSCQKNNRSAPHSGQVFIQRFIFSQRPYNPIGSNAMTTMTMAP